LLALLLLLAPLLQQPSYLHTSCASDSWLSGFVRRVQQNGGLLSNHEAAQVCLDCSVFSPIVT
jgi:hypothetical protein